MQEGGYHNNHNSIYFSFISAACCEIASVEGKNPFEWRRNYFKEDELAAIYSRTNNQRAKEGIDNI